MTVEDRNGHDDPWTRARAAARDDVHAALAPRERRCPACGTAQSGGGRMCTNCGADLTARYAKGTSRRKLLFAVAAVLALAAIAVPVVAGLREDAAGERERAAARQEALEAAERVRLTRDARPVRAEGTPLRAAADPLEHRAALVTEAEALIAADARARVAAGSIKGEIKGAECGPFPTTAERRAAEQDPGTQRRPLRLRRLHVEVRGARARGQAAHRPLRLPLLAGRRVRQREARVVQGHPARRRGRPLARRGARAGALPGPGGTGLG